MIWTLVALYVSLVLNLFSGLDVARAICLDADFEVDRTVALVVFLLLTPVNIIWLSVVW